MLLLYIISCKYSTHTNLTNSGKKLMIDTITTVLNSVTGHMDIAGIYKNLFSLSLFPLLSASTSSGCGSLPCWSDSNLYS